MYGLCVWWLKCTEGDPGGGIVVVVVVGGGGGIGADSDGGDLGKLLVCLSVMCG